jgi:hypothetical protein
VSKDKRGNPDIKEYGFKTDREEPFNKLLAVKVTESMYNQVKSQPDSSEFMRKAIQKALDEAKQDK